MSEYTQGIAGDGAAILKDGEPMTPEEIVKGLQRGERHATSFNYLCQSIEQLEEIVGINTGGMNGPGPLLNAAEKMANDCYLMRNKLDAIGRLSPTDYDDREQLLGALFRILRGQFEEDEVES